MARRQQQAGGSAVVASNFRRLADTFPRGTAPFRPSGLADPGGTSTVPVSPPGSAPEAPTGPSYAYPTPPVEYYPGTQRGFPPPPLVGAPPTRYGAGFPPVTDTAPFVAADVYSKVGVLAALAIAGGAITFLFSISSGIVVGLFLVAFAIAMVTIFRPRQARILAPIYAVTEGLALGGISRYFETSSKGIVPLAVLFTGAVFAGTLAAYRAGLVHVGRRFVVGTTIATFGLVVVLLAAWLGVPVPGASGIGPWSVVIGVVYLFVAVANLFVDFSYVQTAEAQGLSAEGEWYAAFSIMLALVMVYIAMLRILGGRR